MTRKQQRLFLLLLGMVALGGATALVLTAFSSNLVYFYSPSEMRARGSPVDRRVRIGGLVEKKSLERQPDGAVSFRVTDGRTDLEVVYRGILPDLFREGQGVVVEGELQPDGAFDAATVLAKHDARYMPPEVVAALKKTGHWQEGAPTRDAAGSPVAGRDATPAGAQGSRRSPDAAVR